MSLVTKQTIGTLHSAELTSTTDNHLTTELDDSKIGHTNETLIEIIAEQEHYCQGILDGLADVQTGRVVSQSEIVDFASRLIKS